MVCRHLRDFPLVGQPALPRNSGAPAFVWAVHGLPVDVELRKPQIHAGSASHPASDLLAYWYSEHLRGAEFLSVAQTAAVCRSRAPVLRLSLVGCVLGHVSLHSKVSASDYVGLPRFSGA